MGNSPSSPRPPPLPRKDRISFDSNALISKPQSLTVDPPRSAPPRRGVSARETSNAHSNNPFRNRSMAATTQGSSLGVPTGMHRRSRSANAIINRDSAPPPYSAVEPILPSNSPGRPRHSHNGAPARPRSVLVDPPGDNNFPSSGASTSDSLARSDTIGSRHTNVFTVPARADRGSSARSNSRNLEYLRAPMRQESRENALETLRKYDTVIIVDDSRSMEGSLWLEARDALASLADTASQYDTDGIDVYFLNDKKVGINMRSAISVKRLFDTVRPRGITPIGGKLEELLLDYMLNLEHAKVRQQAGDSTALKDIKPVNFIVLTDGSPTDDPEGVIVTAARRLDAGNFPLTQVGIQFVQIGNNYRATEFLQELDDGLSSHYQVRDMVDTTPYTGGLLNAEILTKILLGGINRRVDTRGGASVMGL